MKKQKNGAYGLSNCLAYRTPQVAFMLGIGVTKVKELLRSGELKHCKEGRATLVTKRQLLAFLERKELEAGFVCDLTEEEVYGPCD